MRAVGQGRQAEDFSVRLEKLVGTIPFWGLAGGGHDLRLTEKTKGSRAKQKLPALLDYKSKANIFLRNGQLLLKVRTEDG